MRRTMRSRKLLISRHTEKKSVAEAKTQASLVGEHILLFCYNGYKYVDGSAKENSRDVPSSLITPFLRACPVVFLLC